MQDTTFSRCSKAWSKLSTVTSFDADSTLPIDEMANLPVMVHNVKHTSPSSFLIESLIAQMCNLLEIDPAKQKALYHVICKKLHQMKLIDKTYRIEEFEFMRIQYQKELMQFLSIARSTIKKDTGMSNVILQSPSPCLELTTSQCQEESLLQSRYYTEFVELEYLAKGGFGEVYKARNKLDGGEYAIKKIRICCHNRHRFLQSLQEVKFLARLNHPNIVSYKAAWLEPLNSLYHRGLKREVNHTGVPHIFHMSSRKEGKSNAESEDDSGGVVFKDSEAEKSKHSITSDEVTELSPSNDYHERSLYDASSNIDKNEFAKGVNSKPLTSEDLVKESNTDYNEKEAMYTTSSSCSLDKAVCKYQWNREKMNNLHMYSFIQNEWATLYIQMQLCEFTLRQWLDSRNSESSHVDMHQSLSIFQQIVRGVEYIHSQDIVHHDIKPSNIFVNKDVTQVQVGDLGLACLFEHTSQDVTLMNHTSCPLDQRGEIGTRLYAAPEQLQGECTPKSDIYSLGIVLFELIQPFHTNMERSKLLTELRSGNIPHELISKAPQLVELIKNLVSPAPALRPTAENLLVQLDFISHTFSNVRYTFDSLHETILQLRADLSRKDREIEELKQKVHALELCK